MCAVRSGFYKGPSAVWVGRRDEGRGFCASHDWSLDVSRGMYRGVSIVSCDGVPERGGNEERGGDSSGLRDLHDDGGNVV